VSRALYSRQEMSEIDGANMTAFECDSATLGGHAGGSTSHLADHLVVSAAAAEEDRQSSNSLGSSRGALNALMVDVEIFQSLPWSGLDLLVWLGRRHTIFHWRKHRNDGPTWKVHVWRLLLPAGAAALTLRTRRALRCRGAVRPAAVTAHSLGRWPARIALSALSRRVHLADFELALFHHSVALPIFEMITKGSCSMCAHEHAAAREWALHSTFTPRRGI
jgi:hypothetical protein